MWTQNVWTLGPTLLTARAKGSSVCIGGKAVGSGVSGLGGDMVLWRGPVLG